ncbi:MAG TPA: hypothetical protein VF550_10715 [Polyangia bacterium]
MTTTGTPEGETKRLWGFDFAPLSHPLWWASLALLLLNDNLLKGRAVVPAWLTGKLSDFVCARASRAAARSIAPLPEVAARAASFPQGCRQCLPALVFWSAPKCSVEIAPQDIEHISPIADAGNVR